MRNILKRCIFSFAISSVFGALTNLIIELVVRTVTGMDDFTPISPEFVELFPSETIAVEVNILLYGVIGAGFSAMIFIYENEKIGFIVQNIIYCLLTSIIWVPIVVFVWQLNKNGNALIGTLLGFFVTYIVMSVVGYKITRAKIKEINMYLESV